MTKAHFNLQRIKDVPASEVVRRLGGILRRCGSRYVTQCLWHDDHHPSLTLYETRGENHFYCHACCHSASTIDYAMQSQGWDFQEACEWISHEFGIPYENASSQRCTLRPKAPERPTTMAETIVSVPREYMLSTLSERSTFCDCMRTCFAPEIVAQLAEDYCLGMVEDDDLNGDVIFWSIDRFGTVRNGKVQRYVCNPSSPTHFHCQPIWNNCRSYWIGRRLVREGCIPLPEGCKARDVRFDQDCLFGEHLLMRYPQLPVALVESPKNALVGAAALPQLLWVAVGNKGALKRRVLAPLKGRSVVVFPDRDAVDEWTAQLAGMADIACFSISDFAPLAASEGAKGYDVADNIISQILQSEQPTNGIRLM